MKRILYFQSDSSLVTLAEACLSLTPNLFLCGGKELYLEIGGTQKIFGGEAGLLLKAEDLVSYFGVRRRLVLGDRLEWAKALSVAPEVILPPGKSRDRLWKLPVERLMWCGDPALVADEESERRELVAFLRRVGLETISDFVSLPPTAINRRFGKLGVVLREWAVGEREVIFPPFFAREPVSEAIDTEDIGSLDSLLLYLRPALVKIELRLKGRAVVAKKIKLTFHLESRNHLVKSVDLSHPLQDAQSLLKLLKEFLSTVQWDSPLTRLEVEITDMLPWSPGQLFLFENAESRFHDLAQYVGRLRARLGEEAVGYADFQESFFPESSWKNVWPPTVATPSRSFPERPLFLFSPPRVVAPPRRWRLIPSEDISSEWWEKRGDRAYYIAENAAGEALWVYFDNGRREWFLHGIFD